MPFLMPFLYRSSPFLIFLWRWLPSCLIDAICYRVCRYVVPAAFNTELSIPDSRLASPRARALSLSLSLALFLSYSFSRARALSCVAKTGATARRQKVVLFRMPPQAFLVKTHSCTRTQTHARTLWCTCVPSLHVQCGQCATSISATGARAPSTPQLLRAL